VAIPPTCILTDIEGTTSAIAFVKETLFPFAQAELDAFLDARGAEPEVAAILAEVAAAAPGEDPRAALRRWMEQDAKVTPLKTLQGLIWRAGYADGRHQGASLAGCGGLPARLASGRYRACGLFLWL